ncbi:class I SAM-dependent methyltransferase [Pseudonocardia hierapolitana]|uniref:class I SAM-dependent methyltransferase n=1 Tax=Pseudonocardia hierapolitana TaxID=1128676 RepID=UPI0014797C72|nr:methyltransferase domain-containing protein [Pseudonocardia hierapolitana]
MYEHVLGRAEIGPGKKVLDCGCGAGRFARMAADRGARVAGIDAAQQLVAIAAKRVPGGDFRTGDLEALPWPDDAVDVATGFSSFQFADDKIRALIEAGRVSRDLVVVVIPARVPESGIAAVFKPLFPLFPPEALESMKHSGMFALSQPGELDDLLAATGLVVHDDDEVDCRVRFDDTDTAVRALIGAGPTQLAIHRSGAHTVAQAMHEALTPFIEPGGRVTLPAWFRAVIARTENER